MFLWRIRTKTLQRKGAWELCVDVRRPVPSAAQLRGRTGPRAELVMATSKGEEDAF